MGHLTIASESVTKLFRPASAPTPTTTTVTTPILNRQPSLATVTSESDSLSLKSMVSEGKRFGSDLEIVETSSPDTTSKTFPTASTAVLGDIYSLDSMEAFDGRGDNIKSNEQNNNNNIEQGHGSFSRKWK